MPPLIKCPSCGFTCDVAGASDPDFIVIDSVGNPHPLDKAMLKAEADHAIDDSLAAGDTVISGATETADQAAADTTPVT